MNNIVMFPMAPHQVEPPCDVEAQAENMCVGIGEPGITHAEPAEGEMKGVMMEITEHSALSAIEHLAEHGELMALLRIHATLIAVVKAVKKLPPEDTK